MCPKSVYQCRKQSVSIPDDRTGVSERIDINKTTEAKECDIYHYRFFLDNEFNFQTNVYNWGHNVLMMSMNFNNIAIINIHGIDYRCFTGGITKEKLYIYCKRLI